MTAIQALKDLITEDQKSDTQPYRIIVDRLTPLIFYLLKTGKETD